MIIFQEKCQPDEQRPLADMVLEASDVLRVRASVEKVRKLRGRVGIKLKPGSKWRDS